VQAGTSFQAKRELLLLAPFQAYEFKVYPAKAQIPSHWSLEETATSFGNCQSIPSPPNYDYSLASQANNEALARLVANIRNKQTRLQGGIILGELHETIRLLKSPTKRIKDLYGTYLNRVKKRGHTSAVRRLPVKKRRKVRNAIISDLWLEVQFGVQPFYSDIQDAVKAIKDHDMLESKHYENIRSYAKAENSYVYQRGLNPFGLTPAFSCDEYHTRTTEVIYRGQMEQAMSAAGHALRTVGIDNSSVLPTVWELIPYSFLVDYFSNIGDIVSAASLARQSTTWLVKTTRTERRAEFRNWIYYDRWPDSGVGPGNFAYYTSKSHTAPRAAVHLIIEVTREPYYGSLVPDLEFSIPGMGKRWLNMTALFNNAYQIQRSFL
jgi:hypothetical protein